MAKGTNWVGVDRSHITREKTYYVGSGVEVAVGSILSVTMTFDPVLLSDRNAYDILQRHRPTSARKFQGSVRLYDLDIEAEQEELADYILTVRPLTPIERHDLRWVEHINHAFLNAFDSLSIPYEDLDRLLNADQSLVEQLQAFANAFWAGEPAPPHSLRFPERSMWQYLTEQAEVLAIEKLR